MRSVRREERWELAAQLTGKTDSQEAQLKNAVSGLRHVILKLDPTDPGCQFKL